jgi:hypothetical protein
VTADTTSPNEAEKQVNHSGRANVVRGIFVLLTLAFAFCVAPFASGQPTRREFGKRTLTFPHSLLERQQPKKQQSQTTADSANSGHPKQAEPVLAPPIQGVPRHTAGIDCDNAPGIVIHDDGTVETGYQSGPGILGIFADKFTPASYPSTYTSVCLAFNRLCGGPTSERVEVVVFDDDGPGGSPGTELGAMQATVDNIPIFPDSTPVWNSFDISSLNIVVNDGSVFIGARWTPPSFFDRVFLSSDENGPGDGDGYYFDNFDNFWTPIRNFFPFYRAMFVRAVEQPGKFGGSVTKNVPGGAITKQVGNPDQTFTESHTVQSCQYAITQGTDGIVPGDTDIGNHCDGCDTFVPLPFNFQLYGTTFTGVNVGDNGRLDFVNINEPGGYITACLPAPPGYFTGLPYDNTLFALWQDMRTDAPGDGCDSFSSGCGIFTSVTGSAPNRIFNIEWRTVLYWDETAPQNFEVRLYENDPNGRFDVIFATLTPPVIGPLERAWVSGVQGNGSQGFYTEDFCICWPDPPPQNQSRTYTLTPCATATPTPTATATSTPRPTPTPRGSPIPRVRPTPRPRPSP